MPANHSVGVYGAGAVGGYLGGLLAAAPRILDRFTDLTLLARPLVREAAKQHGLVVRETEREIVTHPAIVTSAREMGPCDLIILCVRAYDVATSLDDLRHLLGANGMVVAMQNGVGSEEVLAAALGRHRVLAGTLTVSVSVDEPGVVRRTSRRGGVALATMDGSPAPAWIVDVLTSTGLPVTVVQDYHSLRWSKLLLNMLGAASTAVLDIDIADIVANPQIFRIEQLAFREATRVMDRQGIRTSGLPGYPVALARRAMRLPGPLAQKLIGPRMAGARSGRSPTMRADIKRGKTEVRWLNGAVVDSGRSRNVRTPVNAALTQLTEELTLNASERDAFAGRPHRLVSYMRSHGVKV